MSFFSKRVKKIDFWDVALIKWSVATFILFVITIWPAAMTWIHSVNPWYFFIAFLIFVARPAYRIYLK